MKDFWKGVLVGGLISGGNGGGNGGDGGGGGGSGLGGGGWMLFTLAKWFLGFCLVYILVCSLVRYVFELDGKPTTIAQQQTCCRELGYSFERFPRLDRPPYEAYLEWDPNNIMSPLWIVREYRSQWFLGKTEYRNSTWQMMETNVLELFDGGEVDERGGSVDGSYYSAHLLRRSGDFAIGGIPITLQPGDPGYLDNPPSTHFNGAGKTTDESAALPPPADNADYEDLTDAEGVEGTYRMIDVDENEVCAKFGCNTPAGMNSGNPVYASSKEGILVHFVISQGRVCGIWYGGYQHGQEESMDHAKLEECLRDNAPGMRWKKRLDWTGSKPRYTVKQAWERSDGRVAAIEQYDNASNIDRLAVYLRDQNSPAALISP